MTEREALELIASLLPRLFPDERAVQASIWIQERLKTL